MNCGRLIGIGKNLNTALYFINNRVCHKRPILPLPFTKVRDKLHLAVEYATFYDERVLAIL